MSRRAGAERFGRADLIGAYRQARKWRDAHPDLREWSARRYRAFAAAFGCDLGSPPERPDGSPPPWMPADVPLTGPKGPGSALAHLFALTVDALERTDTPFDGWLEAPAALSAYRQRHGPAIAAALTAQRHAYRALIDDLVGHVWNLPEDAEVTAEDLRVNGFDPDAARPDPDDYL